jgi:hypothetical protein
LRATRRAARTVAVTATTVSVKRQMLLTTTNVTVDCDTRSDAVTEALPRQTTPEQREVPEVSATLESGADPTTASDQAPRRVREAVPTLYGELPTRTIEPCTPTAICSRLPHLDASVKLRAG